MRLRELCTTPGAIARAMARAGLAPQPPPAPTTAPSPNAYGVPSRLGMAKRVTFLVGRDGKVARVFPEVDPGVHADEVLSAVAAL